MSQDEPELQPNLEAIQQPNQILPGDFVNVADLEQIAQVSPAICRIEAQGFGGVLGSGFLIAPRLVLTNYHVVATVRGGSLEDQASKLQFRFGFKERGTTIFAGRLVKGSPNNPLLASSKMAELDYALLQLAEIPRRQTN